jgi:hypothetical protein
VSVLVRCDSGCDRRRASAPAPNTAVGWELLGLVAALPIADEAQRDGGAAIPEALREPRGVGASSEARGDFVGRSREPACWLPRRLTSVRSNDPPNRTEHTVTLKRNST